MGRNEQSRKPALTAGDQELFGRIAYAMVVVGLWQKTTRRQTESFDFFEIRGQDGEPAFRIGRQSGGRYVLLTLPTGAVSYGKTLAELWQLNSKSKSLGDRKIEDLSYQFQAVLK